MSIYSTIIARLGREPRVGDWYTLCCEEDLDHVRDAEHLADLMDRDPNECPVGFWPTREAALRDLAE